MNDIIDTIIEAFSVNASERTATEIMIVLAVLILFALTLYGVFILMLHLAAEDIKKKDLSEIKPDHLYEDEIDKEEDYE